MVVSSFSVSLDAISIVALLLYSKTCGDLRDGVAKS